MKKYFLLALICLFSLEIVSCDSSSFVYPGEKTFERQLSSLKDGFVEIVLFINPTKKNINKRYAAPGAIIKKKKFSMRNQIADELCNILLNVIKRDDKYTGNDWEPTYEIYIGYTDKIFYFIEVKKSFPVIFDINNLHIFIEGRKFKITKDEANLLKNKLDILLGM